MGILDLKDDKAPCPECGELVLKSTIYRVREKKMCEGCGWKEIQQWNSLVAPPPLLV